MYNFFKFIIFQIFLIKMRIRTSQQIEDWSYSNNNSDNINNYSNKIEDDSDGTINSSDRTIQSEKEVGFKTKFKVGLNYLPF